MKLDLTAENAERFYGSLSPLGYDALKAGDNRVQWSTQLAALLDVHLPGAQTALDLGCGTGDSSALLGALGLQVVGCDISQPMIDLARVKYPGGDFRHADIRALPSVLRGFDLVNLTGDIPNHLLTPADLAATLKGAIAALRAGGLLVLDANTKWTFETLYGATTVLEYPDDFFIWSRVQVQASDPDLYRLRLTRFQGGGLEWVRTDHTVDERYYPLAALKSAISIGGATVVEALAIRRGEVVAADTKDAVKWIVLARKDLA